MHEQYQTVGIFKRFLAYFLDILIVAIPCIILSLFTSEFLSNLVFLFGLTAYNVYFLNKQSATLSKKLLHIKVISKEGHKLSLKRIIVRETIGKILSGILDLGYLWAIADKRRQTWHDKLTGSLVVEVDYYGNPLLQTRPTPTVLKRWSLFFMTTFILMGIPVFVLAYLFLAQPIQIKGQAMAPNYNDGDNYLVKKFGLSYMNFERGDVVVFEQTPEYKFIKRIIGLPGEAIKIEAGKVYINGSVLDEPYLSAGIRTSPGVFLPESQEQTLGKDEYFILGDNRDRSSDSRSWGPIKREDVTGKVWFKYWDK